MKHKIYIDNPKEKIVYESSLDLRGWLIPLDGCEIKTIKVTVDGVEMESTYHIEKEGVLKAYPQLEDKALYSGFSSHVLLSAEGANVLEITAQCGTKSHMVYSEQILYKTEKQFGDFLAETNATNIAEHEVIMVDKKKLFYEDSHPEKSFIRSPNDPRLVTFYLPQFHPIEVNNKIWGKNFTEWTNVTAGRPRFAGHEQPYLPSDLGFYDLRLKSNLKDQIDLAKKHGIYGFCFYYYWFSGEKIMDLPVESFIENKDWDFNFMICWANENWTKRWDGLDNEVIMSQKYLEKDALSFIKDVEHILLDKRYIKNDGKPVLAVYRGAEIKDTKKTLQVWRDYFKKHHNLELEITTMLSFEHEDPRRNGFDAGIEFEPMTTTKKIVADRGKYLMNQYADLSSKYLTGFKGVRLQYGQIVRNALDLNYDRFNFPTYKSVTPSWDNDARKKGAGTVFINSNPHLYAKWLNEILSRESEKTKQPLIFVNAWNEWAEGAVLEPSRKYGHAYLNKTSEVLSLYSKNKQNKKQWPLYGVSKTRNKKIAVIIHAYYIDSLDTISEKIKIIGEEFDIFISTRDIYVERIKELIPNAHISVVPNRGRDVLPFIHIANQLKDLGYVYYLKLHTKKSAHRIKGDGSEWLTDIINKLIPDTIGVKNILNALENEKAGVVGPAGHLVSLGSFMGGNEKHVQSLVQDVSNSKNHTALLDNQTFFAGTMFWGRFDGLGPLLDRMLTIEDFESEKGQVDSTLAHAIERTINYTVVKTNQKIFSVDQNGTITDDTKVPGRHSYNYAKSVTESKKHSIRDDLDVGDNVNKKYDELVNSMSYKVGKKITYLPRLAKKAIKKIGGF